MFPDANKLMNALATEMRFTGRGYESGLGIIGLGQATYTCVSLSPSIWWWYRPKE